MKMKNEANFFILESNAMKHTDKKMPPVQGGKVETHKDIITHKIIQLAIILLVLAGLIGVNHG